MSNWDCRQGKFGALCRIIMEGNTMKENRKGFTLVELVVVIAIIGVLAAILVPSLMGYIKKARLKQCNANAKIAYNVVVGVQGKYIIDGLDYESLVDTEIDCRGDSPVPNNEITQQIYSSITVNGKGSGIMYIGEFENGEGDNPLFVHWILAPNDRIVGQYPGASNDLHRLPTYKTYKRLT